MITEKRVYTVLGLMSGTSLDGLDLALCEFTFVDEQWQFRITHCETVPFDDAWRNRLATLHQGMAVDLAMADTEFGHLSGRLAREFLNRCGVKPGLIASHGQTIFHQPGRGMTFQIGKGAAIAAETGLPVVCDFRSLDVALNGQGAPLVPAGDRLLFPDYRYCLNIGGFANISMEEKEHRVAFDICPANIVLNGIAEKVGCRFDQDGRIARSGKVYTELLEKLNLLEFYHQPPPKSLGKEWVLKYIDPLIQETPISDNDLMATFTEHISDQISYHLKGENTDKVLITGGGAHNKFLVERISQKVHVRVIVPDPVIVNFKEALIFAFLGLMRYTGNINTLSSVTGAKKDSSSGAIY